MSESWKDALLPVNSTVQDAIRSLDQTGVQIVLVVASSRTLIGTITDGDIRRGLLRGLGMKSSLETLMNREPLVAPLALARDAALQLMQANKVHQLPIVDEERRAVGLHLWNDLIAPEERRNMMVIMAGGQGARLRPHTENCPKPMLPVGGRPMLEQIIERVRAHRFRHFTLAIHFLGHMIEDHFGDGSKLKVEINYIREETPLGTAGAISLLAPRPDVPFLVTNGDVLTDINYGELLDFHSRHGAAATMAVRQHEWQHPYGVVRTKGVEITGFDEKPVNRTHVNAGVYVLEPSAMDVLVAGEYCDMPTLFTRLQNRGERTIVYPMHEPWQDVGREDDLMRARAVESGGDAESA